MFNYLCLPLGDYRTNTYLVYEEETKRCAVIDPGYSPSYIATVLQNAGLKPEMVLLTHCHFDHVGGVKVLARMLNLPVWINAKDLALPETMTNGPVYYTDSFEDGDSIPFASSAFTVLETPGHTPGSVCLILGSLLFSGDTLFAGSCGRTDFPCGSTADMRASLKRLASLEGDYTVLPGHGPASTLAAEKQSNPYLVR